MSKPPPAGDYLGADRDQRTPATPSALFAQDRIRKALTSYLAVYESFLKATAGKVGPRDEEYARYAKAWQETFDTGGWAHATAEELKEQTEHLEMEILALQLDVNAALEERRTGQVGGNAVAETKSEENKEAKSEEDEKEEKKGNKKAKKEQKEGS